MSRHAKTNLIQPGEGFATSPLFHKRVEEAVLSVPENPRDGKRPSEPRPMPRNKVAAGFFHALRLSGRDIARLAGGLTGAPVSYGMLRVWRTEPEFRALINSAEDRIAVDLAELYEKSWNDPRAFEAFMQELRVFSEVVAHGAFGRVWEMADHSQAVGRMHEYNIHELNLAKLQLDYGLACGMFSKAALKRAIRGAGLTVSKLVDSLKSIHAAAEKDGDWKLARKAFDQLAQIAAGFAREADAKAERELKRQDAKTAHSKPKKR
jgi:hypothetical protein